MTIAKRERPKLNYRFHDPNPPGVLADYLVKVLVEVNMPKAEAAIQAALSELPEKGKKESVIAKLNAPEHKAPAARPKRKTKSVQNER